MSLRHGPGRDRVPRPMRLLFVILAATSLAAACGQSATSPSLQPTAAPSVVRRTSAERQSPRREVGPGDAFVTTLTQAAGATTGELLVEAVRPDGKRVTVATIPMSRPASRTAPDPRG